MENQPISDYYWQYDFDNSYQIIAAYIQMLVLDLKMYDI